VKHCSKWIGWVVLILGIIYLIADIMNWGKEGPIRWWGLNWWTAVFILVGLWVLTKKKK